MGCNTGNNNVQSRRDNLLRQDRNTASNDANRTVQVAGALLDNANLFSSPPLSNPDSTFQTGAPQSTPSPNANLNIQTQIDDEHLVSHGAPNNFGSGNAHTTNHSYAHYLESKHAYALEIATKRVWDYASEDYVHRFLYENLLSADDANGTGNMTSDNGVPPNLSNHDSLQSGHGLFSASALLGPTDKEKSSGSGTQKGDKSEISKSDKFGGAGKGKTHKAENVVTEFNQLLAEQLSEQRFYYEGLIREKEKNFIKYQSGFVKKLEEKRMETAQFEAAATNEKQKADKLKKEVLDLGNRKKQLTAEREDCEKRIKELEKKQDKSSSSSSSAHPNSSSTNPKRPLNKKEKKAAEKLLVKELKAEIQELQMNLRMKKKFENNKDLKDSNVLFTTG